MGAFIYALSADKTSPALAAHTTQSQPCFLAASIPLPSPAATSFYSNADRAYNTLHFARAGLAEVEGSDLSVLGAPARRKRHIACGELFHFIAELIVRSFCCFSIPN